MTEAEERKNETLLHFGDFTLNLERRGLYSGTNRVHLTSKPLETLIFLVQNRGRVVEKQEILDAVWKDLFVTEDTLVHAIREIRRSLADDRDNPRFILTVPRQGYRFVSDVSVGTLKEIPTVTPPPEQLAQLPPASIEKYPVTQEKRAVWPYALLLGIVALLSVMWLARSISTTKLQSFFSTKSQRRFESPKLETQQLLTDPHLSEGKPALSADGKYLLFTSSTEDVEERTQDGKPKTYGDLFVKELATGSRQNITFKENPSGDIPVFNADGTWAVYSSYKDSGQGSRLPNLYRVRSSGRGPNDTSEPFIREASGAGFSPDGKWVAYTKHLADRKALWRSPAGNPVSEQVEIAALGFTPRWSWDGKWIAYTSSNPNGGLGDMWIVDATTLTGHKNITNEPQQIYGLTWTPDSRSLIFASKRAGPSLLWRVSIDGGPIEPVTGPAGDYATPTMARSGKALVFSYYHGTQNLMVAEGLQAEVRELTKDEYHQWPRLSPDGEHVASVMQRPTFGEHLYLTDLNGQPKRISESAAFHPCWEGKDKLAYLTWDESEKQTRVLEISNINASLTTPLVTFAGRAEWLAMNPLDSNRVAIVLAGTDGRQKIVLRDIAHNKDQVVVEGGAYAGLRWSPDGSTLAWSGPDESGQESDGVWLIDPNVETQPRRIVADGYGPVWSSDGRKIYFSRIGNQGGLWEVDLRSNGQRQLREWKLVPSFDVVGQRLIYCQLSSTGQDRIYSLMIE